MAPLAAALATPGVGTALSIGGTLLNVVSSLRAGAVEREQANVESAFAEAQASQEEARAADEEKRRRQAAAKLTSTQRARFAAQGIDISTGTPLLVVAETLLASQEDVEAIRETGRAKAKTFRVQAHTFRDFGKQSQRATRIGAGSSLLSGLAQASTL